MDHGLLQYVLRTGCAFGTCLHGWPYPDKSQLGKLEVVLLANEIGQSTSPWIFA